MRSPIALGRGISPLARGSTASVLVQTMGVSGALDPAGHHVPGSTDCAHLCGGR